MRAEKISSGKKYPRFKYKCWKCGEVYSSEVNADECCTAKERKEWEAGRKKIAYKGDRKRKGII